MKMEITAIVLKNPIDDMNMLRCSIISVLNQSVPVDEILVVDCSHDHKIAEMITDMQKEGNNIQYLADGEDNRLMRRVRGVKEAHNDWITFLNADDVWISDKIENQIKIVQSNRYKNNLLIITNWYLGSIYPDIPGVIDTVIGGVCHEMQDDKEELLMQYAPHLFSGMFLSKFLFRKVMETCNVKNDWLLFQKLLEYGKIIYLPYTYYIHKYFKTPDYMRAKLEETCDTLIQKKEMIESSYGIAYWNDIIRKKYHDAVCIISKEDLLPLFSLFDFDNISRGAIEDVQNIDEYVYEREMERLMHFCNTHKRVGCYGAGDFGRKILRFLHESGERIEIVIVSDFHKSQEELLGIKIVELSDCDLDSLDGIILAMDLNTFPEVIHDLRMKYNGDIFTVAYSTMSFLKL